ncbi:hypothetical protein B0T21DRAFT_362342 [Apiosordaria backusii]|uniref:Uncharacterized protein n=1 Tax=Apiosordaria backusii TaxID=314023 RepID=A0AA40BS34_9PEZI|nr:hypothetical protein B0T21DRAFT_362342 [Apiosordaria backusii]
MHTIPRAATRLFQASAGAPGRASNGSVPGIATTNTPTKTARNVPGTMAAAMATWAIEVHARDAP